MPEEIAVLIVGAGPTGLVLAIDLARRGVKVRIIERSTAPMLASRGKGLQPRTLEICDDLGVIDEVIAGGAAFPRWRSYRGEALQWEKSVYELLGRSEPQKTCETPYAETWMIPQWRTEEILRQRLTSLAVGVEFGTTFVGLKQCHEGILTTLQTADGLRTVYCCYLVGADGGRSSVRDALQVAFDGETQQNERFLIADLRAEGLANTHWHNWSVEGQPDERVSLCPLPKSDYFQFVAPLLPADASTELSLATAQRLFLGRSGRSDVTLSDARWMCWHTPNTRLARRFRQGSAFLAGDAAHSPPTSPGQGLNISVQDAYNLGWKLGAVLSGAPDQLLDSYEEERRYIDAAVLGLLTEAHQTAIRSDIFNLAHNYRHSPLSVEQRAVPGSVRAGDRSPNAEVQISSGESVRLFDLLRGPHATLLILGSGAEEAASPLPSDLAFPVMAHAVTPLNANDPRSIWQIFGVSEGATNLIFIRPDGYLGACADAANASGFSRAFVPYRRTSPNEQ